MRAVAVPGLAVAVLLTSGCAGPKAPFEVGTQTAPINLVLGARQAIEAAPVGPVVGPLPAGLVPFIPPLPGAPEPTVSLPPVPSPPSLPCPPFDPLSPVSASGITLAGPPQPATYTYRGKVEDTAGTSKATYQGDSTWKVSVSDVDPETGGYEVTTEVTLGKATSKRVLLVLPESLTAEMTDPPFFDPDAPDATDPNAIVGGQVNSTLLLLGLPPLPRVLPNPGRYGVAGIYLVSQSNGSSTFTPNVPIPLLQTPVGNHSFTGMGTDGSTVMTFTSTVTKRTNVNACGTKVEGIEVVLDDGVLAGRTADGAVQQVAFTETLVFGLQFGGLPVHDAGTITTATAPGAALTPDQASRDFSFTVNAVPKPAKS